MATCETGSAGYDNRRAQLGYTTCVTCGEKEARQRKHTVVPLHKSNYMVPANAAELRGINNKGVVDQWRKPKLAAAAVAAAYSGKSD